MQGDSEPKLGIIRADRNYFEDVDQALLGGEGACLTQRNNIDQHF